MQIKLGHNIKILLKGIWKPKTAFHKYWFGGKKEARNTRPGWRNIQKSSRAGSRNQVWDHTCRILGVCPQPRAGKNTGVFTSLITPPFSSKGARELANGKLREKTTTLLWDETWPCWKAMRSISHTDLDSFALRLAQRHNNFSSINGRVVKITA